MWTKTQKEIIWGVSIFALVFFLATGLTHLESKLAGRWLARPVATVAEAVKPIEVEKEAAVHNLKLAFVGDVMLDRGVKYSVTKNLGDDYGQLFGPVKEVLRNYDLLFANLEGPISDRGTDIGGQYSFRFDPAVAPVLKTAGFDVLSVANNHAFNWSETAFTDTLEYLAAEGIVYVGGGFSGRKAYQEKIINVGGVRLAFLAFNEFKAGGVIASSTRAGIALISEKEVKVSVARAKSAADLVIVSYHFGTEYQTTPTAYQKKYAELAIDAGADLIIGHHAHVVGTLAQYKNAYIIYSLGNFIFDQYFSPETMQGGLLEVTVNPATRQIENVTLKKVLLNKFYQVERIE